MFKQFKPSSNFGKQNSIFKNQKNVFFNFPKTNNFSISANTTPSTPDEIVKDDEKLRASIGKFISLPKIGEVVGYPKGMTHKEAETFFLTEQRFNLWKEISNFEKEEPSPISRGMVLSGPQGILQKF